MSREELRAKAIEVMIFAMQKSIHNDIDGWVRDALEALGEAGFILIGPEDTSGGRHGDLTRRPR